jgi:hypothetical protein
MMMDKFGKDLTPHRVKYRTLKKGHDISCPYILFLGYLRAKSRAKQISFLDQSILHYTVHMLFNHIPLILMSAKTIHNMQTILYWLNIGVKQDELIRITEPFLKIVSR